MNALAWAIGVVVLLILLVVLLRVVGVA